MVLISLALPTAPGKSLWTSAIVAARPRNQSLPAPRRRVCIFHSLRTRCAMVARRRCKPMMRISCTINAVTRYPHLNLHRFPVHLSLHSHLRRTASVKVVSPLRLASCPSMIPTYSPVFLPMGSRSSPTSVWACCLIHPMRRRCRRACTIPIRTKVATAGCR